MDFVWFIFECTVYLFCSISNRRLVGLKCFGIHNEDQWRLDKEVEQRCKKSINHIELIYSPPKRQNIDSHDSIASSKASPKPSASTSCSPSLAKSPRSPSHKKRSILKRDLAPSNTLEQAMRIIENATTESQPSEKKQRRVGWSKEEEKNLVDGVAMYGEGNWAIILRNFEFHGCRDSVSLKDKWRNIVNKRLRTKAMEKKR